MPINYRFANNAYWVKQDDGSFDGPYCMGCHDKLQMEKDLVIHVPRLKKLERDFTYECPVCGQRYSEVSPPKN